MLLFLWRYWAYSHIMYIQTQGSCVCMGWKSLQSSLQREAQIWVLSAKSFAGWNHYLVRLRSCSPKIKFPSIGKKGDQYQLNSSIRLRPKFDYKKLTKSQVPGIKLTVPLVSTCMDVEVNQNDSNLSGVFCYKYYPFFFISNQRNIISENRK